MEMRLPEGTGSTAPFVNLLSGGKNSLENLLRGKIHVILKIEALTE